MSIDHNKIYRVWIFPSTIKAASPIYCGMDVLLTGGAKAGCFSSLSAAKSARTNFLKTYRAKYHDRVEIWEYSAPDPLSLDFSKPFPAPKKVFPE